MEVQELINRFFEETNYKDEALLMIAYGSRIMGTNKPSSDLDLLIIKASKGSYRSSLFIDGIPIDITIMSCEDAETNIIYSKANGSAYFDAVLKNGLVVLDKIGLYDDLVSLLSCRVKSEILIDAHQFNELEHYLYNFKYNSDNKNMNYYASLELLRRMYHTKTNSSHISTAKVYDLYTNKKKAKEQYTLKLPDDTFMANYLEALQEQSDEKRNSWLEILFQEIEDIEVKDPGYGYLDYSRKQIKLVSLNNAIWRCEDMILFDHPQAIPLYYVLIAELAAFYELLFGQKMPLPPNLDTNDKQKLIDNLEFLFAMVDIDHNIDYNDYKIRIR